MILGLSGACVKAQTQETHKCWLYPPVACGIWQWNFPPFIPSGTQRQWTIPEKNGRCRAADCRKTGIRRGLPSQPSFGENRQNELLIFGETHSHGGTQ